ncbi:MAG: glutamine-synthetase adenylyltransferase, partial [Pseudomonadota bacterium]
FRTDLRLRPDPSVTPVCVLTSQALQYYESVGRTWERAAFIKARVCAGHQPSGQAFLSELTPFVWRKYLDFAAIQEAHDLRLKIWEQGQQSRVVTVPGHDVKLGRGGIRDIEFFTQTRQLIAGGRNPDLRDTATLQALAALAQAGWVEPEVADQFTQNYKRLRFIEHAIQMRRDTQTQTVPTDPADLDCVAALLGQTSQTFVASTQDLLVQTHQIANAFFDPPKTTHPQAQFDTSVMDKWPDYPALRTERGAGLFAQVKPKILADLSKAADPNDALAQFDEFLKGLPAGVQVFSLFAANPKLVDLFTHIVSTAPALARYLGRNARVLDSVVSGSFFSPWPGADGLAADLAQIVRAQSSYEDQLDSLRAARNEWHFRIGVHVIQGLLSPQDAVAQYSDLAEAVLRCVVPAVEADFQRKFGTVPAASWCVLGMGSLGARSISANSDLDLMVIFDADPDMQSDGQKTLYARPYFGRLTQALITALTAPMPNGKLYEVDMRLRPSGKAGPIATRIEAFESYQRTEAWTWEHLALTRARPITGDAKLMDRLEKTQLSRTREDPQSQTITPYEHITQRPIWR